MRFLCSGRENNPNASMLCLFYLNVAYTLTANTYLCFLDWWRLCNWYNLTDCMCRRHVSFVCLHRIFFSCLHLLSYFFSMALGFSSSPFNFSNVLKAVSIALGIRDPCPTKSTLGNSTNGWILASLGHDLDKYHQTEGLSDFAHWRSPQMVK